MRNVSTISVCSDPTSRAFLSRLYLACRQNRVQVDADSQQEAEDLGFEATEIENVLRSLTPADLEKCVPSQRYPGHLVWVFTPRIDEVLTLWIRMVELSPLVVVFSFHDRGRDED